VRLKGITESGDEDVRILNIDRVNSRVRVLRESVVGLSHTARTKIQELPNRFNFNIGVNTTYSPKQNAEYYFYPL